MKFCLCTLFLLVINVGMMAAPQDARPPLSKDEIMDLLTSSTPSKVIVSTIKQQGIAFRPTSQVLEEFRKAGADQAVLAALREAWHPSPLKPLTMQEIRMLLGAGADNDKIVMLVLGRGIDFQATADYLTEIRSAGANDKLIERLRTAMPRPLSKAELVQLLTARKAQEWIMREVQRRAIDFEPSRANLQALRNAGAQAPLLEAVRTARRAKPFASQASAAPGLLVKGRSLPLRCGPSDSDVPVLADPQDLGNVVARLRCGEQVTFVEKVAAPPGFDKIQYGDGKEGFVANAYLESPAQMSANATPPIAIYKPEAPYTDEARRHRTEGVVKLSVVIDTQGRVSEVEQTSAPLGDGLDQSAIATVKTWRFAPSTHDGVPVAVRVQVEITFRLGADAH